jgi:hypothetical protein
MLHGPNSVFLRDVDKKQADFVVTIDEKPRFSIEAKISETVISPHLRYFREKLKTPYSYQVLKKSGIDRLINAICVVSEASPIFAGYILRQ